MYQFSNLKSFLNDLQHPHKIQVVGRWVVAGVEVDSPFPISSGSVTVDLTATYLRTCSVTIPAIAYRGTEVLKYVPAPQGGGSSLATPWGTEIKLYRSIVGIGGTTYPLIPLGVFRLAQVSIVDTQDGLTISLNGYDRSYTVGIQLWTDTYHIAKGTNLNTAISDILEPRFPWHVTTNFPATTATTSALTFGIDAAHNPWTVAWTLARAHGKQLYFDVTGQLLMQDWPNPGGKSPVWTLTASSTSALIDVTRNLSNTPLTGNATILPNHVIAFGESTSLKAPMRADAKITDPHNPLRVGGPYGDVPFIVTTNRVLTQAHLQAYANTLLQQYTGQDEQIVLDCIENPALEVNDVIKIEREVSNTNGNYFVTGMVHSLEPETPMQVTCQRAVGYDGYSGNSTA